MSKREITATKILRVRVWVLKVKMLRERVKATNDVWQVLNRRGRWMI